MKSNIKNINICILLTLLTIIILILYFYLNRIDTRKENKETKNQEKKGQVIQEKFYNETSNNLTKYVVLVHTNGHFLHIKQITLYDKNGNEIPKSTLTAQSNSVYLDNQYSQWHANKTITGNIDDNDAVFHSAPSETQETTPKFYFNYYIGGGIPSTYKSPYLLITLNTATELSRIKIRNRIDCCQYRLNGAKLIIYDENLREQWQNTLMNFWGNVGAFYNSLNNYTNSSSETKKMLDLNFNVDYNPSKLTKYVVLVRTGTYTPNIDFRRDWDPVSHTQYCINLSRVQLYGINGTEIIPPNITAHTNSYVKDYPPSNLIDENIDNFAHTLNESKNKPEGIPHFNFRYYSDPVNDKSHDPPYFIIALKEPTELSKIVITNRTGCCQDRVDNIKVILYNDNIENLREQWSNLREQWSYTIRKESRYNSNYEFYGGNDKINSSLILPLQIDYNISNNWNDKGCFNDVAQSRLIKPSKNHIALNTNYSYVHGSDKDKREQCMKLATEMGGNIVGLQFGDECWFGTDDDDNFRKYNMFNGDLEISNPKYKKNKEDKDFLPSCTEMGGGVTGRIWTLKSRPEPTIDFSTKTTKTYRIVIERPKYDTYDDDINNYNKEIAISKVKLYTNDSGNDVQIMSGLNAYSNRKNPNHPPSNLIAYNNNNHAITKTRINENTNQNFEILLTSETQISKIYVLNEPSDRNLIKGVVLKCLDKQGYEIFKYYFNEIINQYDIPININTPSYNLPIPYNKLTKYLKLEKINFHPYISATHGLPANMDLTVYKRNNQLLSTNISGQGSQIMTFNLDEESRISKININNNDLNDKIIGSKLSGFDKDNNILYTYNLTRNLKNYIIQFNVGTVFTADITKIDINNQTSVGVGIPQSVKTIKLQKLNNEAIGLARIYIYDDKNQLIKNNLDVYVSPQSNDTSHKPSNLVLYNDGLDTDPSMNIGICRSLPSNGSSFANIEIRLNLPQEISKIILLNYYENDTLSNLIMNTDVSFLGDSGNVLKTYRINQDEPKDTYEIDARFYSGS